MILDMMERWDFEPPLGGLTLKRFDKFQQRPPQMSGGLFAFMHSLIQFSLQGEPMTDLVGMLKIERVKATERVAALDQAIKALNGNTEPTKRNGKKSGWKMSAEARARISAAQKKRWAKVKK
jgi:hypothetical protein